MTNAIVENRSHVDLLDDKGRPEIAYMTEKELLTETVQTMRAIADALQELSANPMLMALMPKGIRL